MMIRMNLEENPDQLGEFFKRICRNFGKKKRPDTAPPTHTPKKRPL